MLAAYRDAIPPHHYFAWDATRGQLELFSHLGIRKPLAKAVMVHLDDLMGLPAMATANKRPLHVVLFTGVAIDDPGRAKPRFPLASEPLAQQHIRDTLSKLKDGKNDLLLLGSAEPGADILAHEACRALDIPSVLCLPVPGTDFLAVHFGPFDNWRSRMLTLLEGRVRNHDMLVLGDQPGLPRWMSSRGDAQERASRWHVPTSLHWRGATQFTLLALWDGVPDDNTTGGTPAKIINLARQAGKVQLLVIPLKLLTN